MSNDTELTPGTWMICTKEQSVVGLSISYSPVPVGYLVRVNRCTTSATGGRLFAGEYLGATIWFAADHFAVAKREDCDRMAGAVYGSTPKTEITNVSYDHGTRLVSFTATGVWIKPSAPKLAHGVSFGLDTAGDIGIMWAAQSPSTKPPLPRAATRTQVQPIGLRVPG